MRERGKEIMKCSLERLGLTQTEISTYQTALSLGARPASVIAKTLGIQRTRAYDVLQSLENRGLVERVEKNRVRYFSPKSPEKVLALLDEQRSLVTEQMHSFKSALPELLGSITEDSIDCEVRRFRGAREIKDALTSLLEEPDSTIYSIGDIDVALRQSIGLSHWAKDFSKLRLKNKIQLNIACNGAPDIICEFELHRKTLFNPCIPRDMLAIFGSDQLICLSLGSNSAGTSISSKFVVGILKSMHDAWLETTEKVQ